MLFADLALARRLETTDALAGVEFARTWARLNSFTSDVRVRRPAIEEAESYSLLVAKSFFENAEVSPALLDIFSSCFQAAGAFFFMAEVDGVPAGGGMMSIHQGVASFGGAGTVPEFRNRGVQRALLLARLSKAAESGCDLTMVATNPRSGSPRHR